VVFEGKLGEHLPLTGVYYILRLTTSIISLNQLDEGGGRHPHEKRFATTRDIWWRELSDRRIISTCCESRLADHSAWPRVCATARGSGMSAMATFTSTP
jgi:hypothetical protein